MILLIAEIKDAFIDIRIALEKKSIELNKKGLATVVGVVLTTIPMLIPKDIANISPDLIAGLLGATTLIGTVPPLLDSFIDKRAEKKDNPYWLAHQYNYLLYPQWRLRENIRLLELIPSILERTGEV